VVGIGLGVGAGGGVVVGWPVTGLPQLVKMAN
jgi:hypothetical protein